MLASLHGHIESRVRGGADVVQAAQDDGTTALTLACQKGHIECVRALLDGGADVARLRGMMAGLR
jgi:ankyrin repeat protein